MSWEKPSTGEFSQSSVVESVGDECLERKMSLWVLGFLAFMGVKIKGSLFLTSVKSFGV